MKEKLVMWVVAMFMERLSAKDLKIWVDMGLDFIENTVEESPNKTDDMVVLPMCKIVRTAFSIPDND